MLIRVLLALLLLSVVVAVSYIKSVRGNESEASSEGRVEETSEPAVQSQTSDAADPGLVLPDELVEYGDNIDSLHSLIEQMDHRFAESLAQRDLDYGQRIDSLFDVLDSVECELDSHNLVLSDVAIAQGEVVESETSPEEVVAQKSRSDEVIEFYKKQYASLPGDLTAYERKVSLYEIRLETAKKFRMTLTELKQMREESGVTY
jgi:hypothetical protein